MSREAMQQALEALESDPISHAGLVSRKQAITALRKALETKQEQVECMCGICKLGKREWVGLREDEIFSILENLQTIYNRPPTEDSRIIFAKTIEAKLKEKNT